MKNLLHFCTFIVNAFFMNAQQTPKDSLGINQPTLIEDLNPGLYKVEKNYEDGETEQNIIFKGN